MANQNLVSAAEFIRNFGAWQERALINPVSITHHGRTRLVVTTPDKFEQSRTSGTDIALSQELEAAKARTNVILEAIDLGFSAFDAELRFTRVNRHTESYLNAAREDIIGRPLLDLLPQAAGTFCLARVERVLATGVPARFTTPSVSNPGHFLAHHLVPFEGGVADLWRNVTDAELLAREAEAGKAVTAATHAHECVAIVEVDTFGRISDYDPTFAAWMEFAPNALCGVRLSDIAAPASKLLIGRTIEKVLTSGSECSTQASLLARTGDEIDIALAFSPRQDRARICGAVAVATKSPKQAHEHGRQPSLICK